MEPVLMSVSEREMKAQEFVVYLQIHVVYENNKNNNNSAAQCSIKIRGD